MAPVKRIVIVDRDHSFRRLLTEQLAAQDAWTIGEAEDAEAALASADPVDAVLLSAEDPAAAIRRLRDAEVRCPVILLAEAGSDGDALIGPATGANDVIVKPFRLGALLVRLRSQLELYERSQEATIAVGPYTFRPAAKTLQRGADDERIRLTEKETAILLYLHQAGGRVVSREMLLGEVWGYTAGVTTHTLETHIYRLRQKIEGDPANAEILVTDAGGYRLATWPA
jgi:DNA-binding response OmpR family regulator